MQSLFKNVTSGHVLVSAILALFLFVIVTGIWAVTITGQGPLKETTFVEVERGDSLIRIANKLEAQGVITSPFLFKVSAKMMFADKGLKAGGYEFSAGISMRDAIKKMARGHVATFNVTIPEGLRSFEVEDILKKTPHLRGDFDNLNLHESRPLLAETYQYTYGENVATLVARMQSALNRVLDEAWQNRADNLPLKTKEEMLTLASIVEKETSLDHERTEIAGVFINRLNKGMRLQSDPTVIYGIENFDGNITRRHLRKKHPYNTYVIRSLPPHAIAFVGKASILAVANPKKTENFYFVADMTGGHVFAKTYKEHEKNVAEYIRKYREAFPKK